MENTKLAKILKALSHPKRLELYCKIAEHNESSFDTSHEFCGCFVTEMIRTLKLGAPTISHHLKELENAELIVTERRGKFLYVTIKEGTLEEVTKVLSNLMQKN